MTPARTLAILARPRLLLVSARRNLRVSRRRGYYIRSSTHHHQAFPALPGRIPGVRLAIDAILKGSFHTHGPSVIGSFDSSQFAIAAIDQREHDRRPVRNQRIRIQLRFLVVIEQASPAYCAMHGDALPIPIIRDQLVFARGDTVPFRWSGCVGNRSQT
jgi:hypothetical protein